MVVKATVHKQGSVQRLDLLTDLNFHSVSGLDKHFTWPSLVDCEFLISVIGGKKLGIRSDAQKANSVRERLALTPIFLGGWGASGNLCVGLQ